MGGRFGFEVVFGVLAFVGLWVTVDKATAGILRAWAWARRDRVAPLLEDDPAEVDWDPDREGPNLCRGCLSDQHCDGGSSFCECTCGLPEDWADGLEDLPPERSAADLGFGAERERRAPPWEAFQRIQYEAMGFDYPSGLMARVRELTP